MKPKGNKGRCKSKAAEKPSPDTKWLQEVDDCTPQREGEAIILGHSPNKPKEGSLALTMQAWSKEFAQIKAES